MNSIFEPGPLAEVDCAPSGDRWTLVFVRDIRLGITGSGQPGEPTPQP